MAVCFFRGINGIVAQVRRANLEGVGAKPYRTALHVQAWPSGVLYSPLTLRSERPIGGIVLTYIMCVTMTQNLHI